MTELPNTPRVERWPCPDGGECATVKLREGMILSDIRHALNTLPATLRLRLVAEIQPDQRWDMILETWPE
jgi:hypothetical protein